MVTLVPSEYTEKEEKEKVKDQSSTGNGGSSSLSVQNPPKDSDVKNNTEEPDVFAAYVRVWCINRLFFTYMYPSTDALALLPVVLAAFVQTSFPLCLWAHIGSICAAAWYMPFTLTSDIWAALLDFSVVVVMVLFPPWRNTIVRNTIVTEWAKVIVPQLGIFYFSAGFWKFNSSHLDHRSSCSTILVMQMLDRITPEGEHPLWFLNLAAQWGGHGGMLLESSIGVFLLLPGSRWFKRIGSLLAILLHVFIFINPTPNNAAVFGAKIMPRFFFVAPLACAEVFKEISKVPSQPNLAFNKGIIVSVAVLALAIFVGIRNGNGELGPNVKYDWFVPWNTLQMIVLIRVLWLDTKGDSSGLFSGTTKNVDGTSDHSYYALGKAHHVLLHVVSLFYAFGTIILGCQQMGTAAGPFANLRIHGGSNHYLLPTGLLQEWSVGPYAGGVVRVDDTNSSFLRKLYPHEISHNFSPRARAMMVAAGHTGREWMPLFSRTAGAYLPFSDYGRVPHVPYTVPALELRRLLLEARQRGEPFFLHYSKLPASEKLDSMKSLTPVNEQVQFSMDAHGAVICSRRVSFPVRESKPESKSVRNENQPCASDELALLPEPSWWAMKFHIAYPIPLPNDSPEVVCAT